MSNVKKKSIFLSQKSHICHDSGTCYSKKLKKDFNYVICN